MRQQHARSVHGIREHGTVPLTAAVGGATAGTARSLATRPIFGPPMTAGIEDHAHPCSDPLNEHVVVVVVITVIQPSGPTRMCCQFRKTQAKRSRGDPSNTEHLGERPASKPLNTHTGFFAKVASLRLRESKAWWIAKRELLPLSCVP